MSHKTKKDASKKDATRAAHLVLCCHGDDCLKHGARETYKALRAAVREHDLKHDVHLLKTECMDACKHAPMLIVCDNAPSESCGATPCGATPCGIVWYRRVKAKDAAQIVSEHLQHGRVVDAKRFREEPDEKT